MNKRSNYKGKRNSRKDFDNRDKSSSDSRNRKGYSAKESPNDPSWYTISPQLTKDAASVSFNNPSGVHYDMYDSAHSSFINPGIMNIYMAPTAGYSNGLSSPLNIAAKNFYSFIRSKNAGGKNYDSPDLMLYLLAVANAYGYYAWLVRLYGIMRVYTQSNRYWGRNAVRACRVDPDSLQGDLANFRAYINQYVLKLSALSVPSTMSLYRRWVWMYSNMFADENTTKAQIYMYQPAFFYQYDEYNGAGRLIPKPLTLKAADVGTPADLMTFADLQNYGDALIGALIASEDIAIMSGDIIKAYDNNLFTVNLIDENYAIVPIFSEEVLLQVHNTTFVGCNPLNTLSKTATTGWDSFNIYQDTNIGEGCLICTPAVKYGASGVGKRIMDTWKSDPTPEDVMVASRNMVATDRQEGYTIVVDCGTEIPMYASVINLAADGTQTWTSEYANDTLSGISTMNVVTFASRHTKLDYFNERPFEYFADYASDPVIDLRADLISGEVSNFTLIDPFTLRKMHLTAVMSEFAIPYLGNIVDTK